MEDIVTLKGKMAGLIYRNEENGYSIISVKQGKSIITVKGQMPIFAIDEELQIRGRWVEDKKYGHQLEAACCSAELPTTREGIIKYLSSGAVKNVGKSRAKTIVNRFGMDTLEIMSEHPERLAEIKGISMSGAMEIARSFQENEQNRSEMIFLQQYDISQGTAKKIINKYGSRAVEIINENPYRLLQDGIEGIGFATVDKAAISMGIPPDNENRVQGAMVNMLVQSERTDGNVYLTEEELIQSASRKLEISPDICRSNLEALSFSMRVKIHTVSGEKRVYTAWMDRAERETAMLLCELILSNQTENDMDAEEKIDSFELRNRIKFSEKQRLAISKAVNEGVLVVTGGPGTGKTTIIKCIISMLAEYGKVLLCAPTGRAAKRMSETTGMEAKTIHRLLEYGGENVGFGKNQSDMLECSSIIVDEMSMVDLSLMRALLRAIKPGTRLIMVGDADQLPSVGAGNVLDDVLRSGIVPSVRLTEIFRQSQLSRIVVNAHRINHGEMPLLNEKGTDFFFERKESSAEVQKTIVQLLTKRLPAYMKYDAGTAAVSIQVLSPMRKGICGVNALNPVIRDALNPLMADAPEVMGKQCDFRLGDKVIQTKNEYEKPWIERTPAGDSEGEGIFNGDMGFVTAVYPEDGALTVTFDGNREVTYNGEDELENLELAYCLSVHKSQGSEFPVVVIPVVSGPAMLLTRNLFYTAVTRAKKLVVLVGSESVIKTMVENNRVIRRNSSLDERLIDTMRAITDGELV